MSEQIYDAVEPPWFITEIERLKSELERGKAEKARLAAELKEYERTEPLKKAECMDLVNKLVLYDAALRGCLSDAYLLNDEHEWGITRAIENRMKDLEEHGCTALRDLLGPVERLLAMLETDEHSANGASHKWKLIDKQLTHIRAAMGGRK